LVFPANTEVAIQCPACKKLVDVEDVAESKLLRTCPQCDTLLGNPTNAPKVLCPLCMKLIEWSIPMKDITPEEDQQKTNKRKSREQQQQQQQQAVVVGTNPDGSPLLASPKKKKGYVKKGELGYVRPKYSYVKKGQPGYNRPKYSYVRKGQPGYRSFKSKKNKIDDDTNQLLKPESMDSTGDSLLNHGMDGSVETEWNCHLKNTTNLYKKKKIQR